MPSKCRFALVKSLSSIIPRPGGPVNGFVLARVKFFQGLLFHLGEGGVCEELFPDGAQGRGHRLAAQALGQRVLQLRRLPGTTQK